MDVTYSFLVSTNIHFHSFNISASKCAPIQKSSIIQIWHAVVVFFPDRYAYFITNFSHMHSSCWRIYCFIFSCKLLHIFCCCLWWTEQFVNIQRYMHRNFVVWPSIFNNLSSKKLFKISMQYFIFRNKNNSMYLERISLT